LISQNLNGVWKLYYFPQGKYPGTKPENLNKLEGIPAEVPGNVELDLAKAGELPENLYFGENILSLKPYETYEWWYEREFIVPKEASHKFTEIIFHGVDCLAEYWLNGEPLGNSDNMFIEHRFAITGRMKVGDSNTITVRLRSPLVEAAEKIYEPLYSSTWIPLNMQQIWIRKAGHSYGWDIMPRALSAGLWRTVELVIHDEIEINDLYFHTVSIAQDEAVMKVHFEVNATLEHYRELDIRISGRCGDSSFTTMAKVTFKAGATIFKIADPKLWWPRGYGEAELYEVCAEIIFKGKVVAKKKDMFGIRTVELLRTETTSVENPGEFLFKINGTKIMCKGSNWVPADAFHSRDAERYEKILSLFEDLNCNMIRCWGGNVYEDHEFFQICDRSGFMVWQDFAMACAIYPQIEEFYEKIRKEAVAVVRKLRRHPSIVLWSGDNECDSMAYAMGYDPGFNKITREVLPQAIFPSDPFRPYLPSSPYVSPVIVQKKNLRLMPEDHLWGPRDYFKSKFYAESPAHFASEMGYHGCPNLTAIKSFIDGQYLWPYQGNSQWILHSSDQMGNPYRVKLMADQIIELFGSLPDNLDEFIIASQISQAEAKKFFIEMTRIRKWEKTGILWWNVMDGWPQFSDAIVDYYFGKKLAYYFIKRIQQPFCIMLDEPENWHVNVVAGNDSLKDYKGQYRIWDADTDQTLQEGRFHVKANENRILGAIRVSRSDKKLLLVEWSVNGEKYGNHYLLGTPPFSLDIYRKWLHKIAGLQGDFDENKIGI
jgi:beta-mannosidase